MISKTIKLFYEIANPSLCDLSDLSITILEGDDTLLRVLLSSHLTYHIYQFLIYRLLHKGEPFASPSLIIFLSQSCGYSTGLLSIDIFIVNLITQLNNYHYRISIKNEYNCEEEVVNSIGSNWRIY